MNPLVDPDILYEKLVLKNDSEGWLERFREFQRQTEVARIRRSAGDPLNQVIYIALGVMKKAYAGCSGNGARLDVTLAQFVAARKVLETKDFSKITRPPNQLDRLLQRFATAGTILEIMPFENHDVAHEREFCEKCIAFLKAEKLSGLTVSFS